MGFCIKLPPIREKQMGGRGWVSGWTTTVSLTEAWWLAGGREHGAPQLAVQIEMLAAGGDDVDGHMDELAIKLADDQPGPAEHGGVCGVAAQAVAE